MRCWRDCCGRGCAYRAARTRTPPGLGIERVLRIVDPTVDPLDTALLLEVLGYGERSAIDPLSRQRVLLRLLRRILAAYTERSPLLIVAEDLHWADPASVALLTEVARDMPSRRCLLLSTSRPGPLPPWDARRDQPRSAAPGRRPSAGRGRLRRARRRCPGRDDPGTHRRQPFFIEEVARSTRDFSEEADR